MSADLLLQTLARDPALAPEATGAFCAALVEKAFPKGSFLLREGAVAGELFFITAGVVRQYFGMEGGTAHACTFTLPGAFVTNIESFMQRTPSATAMDALVDTTCCSISCEALKKVMDNYPAIAAYFQREVEKVAVENAVRIRKLLSQSAAEKYRDLVENNPDWIAHIPQHYLAQYIGVAPESLSRIRRKIAGR